MKQKKNPRGGGYPVYGNKEGFIPNWAGFGVSRATTDREVQHFPQKWQSPLLSWTNYYIPLGDLEELKLGELQEHPEQDNLQPSSLNDIKVNEKVQRLIGEESTNNPNTSAQHCENSDDIVWTASKDVETRDKISCDNKSGIVRRFISGFGYCIAELKSL